MIVCSRKFKVLLTPSELCINNRLYKQYGSLGFASSELFINRRLYTQSGPHGITNLKVPIHDRFYKQFWHCVSHRLSAPKQFFFKTIVQSSNPGVLKKNCFVENCFCIQKRCSKARAGRESPGPGRRRADARQNVTLTLL